MNPDLTKKLSRPLRIVAVGDELLRGDRADSNSPWLAARLGALGWVPDSMEQIADRAGAVEAVVRRWREEGGTLFMGGGLGPTEDDATRQEIASGLGVPLELNEDATALIRATEARRRWSFTEHTHAQARLPRGCRPLENAVGTAPGILCESGEGFLLAMPGVPLEYMAIAESALPLDGAVAAAREWRLAGLGEDKLASLVEGLPGLEKLGFYPTREGIRLRVPEGVDEDDLARRLDAHLVSREGGSLEAAVLTLLAERGETLALAESCTGGMLGARITRVPGASEVFRGGVQSYANDLKMQLLGLPESLLMEHGAVSEACARAMAEGARARLGAHWALSVTGIAGPGGGTEEKPVGTMHIALAGPCGLRHRHRVAGWDRENNRRYAAQEALTLLWQVLREKR